MFKGLIGKTHELSIARIQIVKKKENEA